LLFPPRVRTYPIAHAWCRWQKSDRIDDYSQWVQRLFFGGFLNDSLRKSLEREMSSGLIRLAWHSSGLLLDWVREKTGHGNLKDFLNLARLWPERADVPTFLDSLARVVDSGLWGSFPQEQRSTLFQELRPWSLMGQKFSRFSFIEWLEASLRECFSETPSYASPSAEVCLITPAEFDHGMWPCVFLLHSAERLGKRHPWTLNPFLKTTGRASRQKSLSEASHHSPLAGNTELGEEDHEQEPFLALNLKKIRRKYAGEHGYFFSISRANGDTGSPSVAIASPSPTESNGSASGPLRRKSPSPSPSGHPSTMPEPFGELKKNHRERRDPQVPFGAWDYSLGAPLGKYFTFPCKTWEALLCNPEEAWYRYLLRRGDFWDFPEADWRKIVLGTWVHDFLHFPEASENALNLPESAAGCLHIQARAERFWRDTEAFFSKRGQRIPPVWEMLWREALDLAQRLFQRVAQQGKACPFRSEFALPEGSHLSFASGHTLALSGRIDLCLERGTQTWIVDYKTGGDMPLAHQAWYRLNAAGQALVSARGLQLLLYGLALRSSGWKNIYLCVLRPDAPDGEEVAKAVCLEALEGNPAFRQFLDVFEKIVASGTLGLRPASYFAPKRFRKPLAVLPIEEAVLQKRCLKSFACLWE
ncbi:MAG: PD-(D/E)XK nuclease family protein, partial [Puniceicoccales bacterium]|nr:PD-(D/E)XK nuclease family protein [Puniceicoccales bacterium]